jgi:PleD family two-component response regulator
MNQATDLYNQQSKLDLEVDSSKGVYEFKKGDDVDDFIKQCDYEMYREKIEKHHLNKKNI